MSTQTEKKKTSNNRHSRSSADVPLNPNVTGNYGYEPPWLVIFRRIKKEARKMNKHHDEKGIAADPRGMALLLAVTLATITISLLFQYFLR